MPPSSSLLDISPSSLKFIEQYSTPVPPNLTYRSALVSGTGRGSTSRFYDHDYLPSDPDMSVKRHQRSSSWSHPPRSSKNPSRLFRVFSFPQSFLGHRFRVGPEHSSASALGQPRSCDRDPSVPSTIRSPQQASWAQIKNAGLPSRADVGKPRKWKGVSDGYISFKSLLAQHHSLSAPPPQSSIQDSTTQADSLSEASTSNGLNFWRQIVPEQRRCSCGGSSVR